MFKLLGMFEPEEKGRCKINSYRKELPKFKLLGTKFEILFIVAFVILVIMNFTVPEAPTLDILKVNLRKFHDHNDNEVL